MILEMLHLKKREDDLVERLKEEEQFAAMEAFFGDTAIIVAAQELNQLREATN